MQEEPKYLEYIGVMPPYKPSEERRELFDSLHKLYSGENMFKDVVPSRPITGSYTFKLSEGLANAMKGVGVAFKSATKAISSFGKLKISINADTSKFRQAMHKCKQRVVFKKTLQKLPIKLRCKLRNSMWRNK